MLIPAAIFPPVGYWKIVYPFFAETSSAKGEQILLEAFENFPKQTFRNRYKIMGVQGLQLLTVPVQLHGKILAKDLKIDHTEAWGKFQLKAIRTAYGKAPYFEEFFPNIERILLKPTNYLLDLQLASLTYCLKSLRLKGKFELSESFLAPHTQAHDYRWALDKHGIASEVEIKAYPHLFGQEFAKDVSMIDALMVQGPTFARQLLLKKEVH